MSSSSNPRDHRGRYVPGSSARPHSSRSSSHSHNNSRPSQPYVTSSSNHNHTTDDWENPEYAEGYYRRQFMERRSQNNDYYQDPPPRPSAPPMEEDEVLARRLQHEMNSDFLQDRNVVVVPPTSRYVITPVDNEMEVPYQQQRQQYQSSSRAAEPDGYSYSTSNRRKNLPQDNNYRYSTSTAAAAVARGTNNVGMSSSSSYPKKSSRRDMMIADLDEEEDLRLAQQLQDEELARQLEQEEAEARRKAARQQQQQQQKKARASTRSTTATTTSFSDSSSEEQAAARRVAQEMEDAEIAQRLSLYEQEVAANQVQESQANNRSHLIWHRLLPLLCCAVAIIVSLLFVLNVFDGEKVRNGINDWVDPFKGDVAINGSPAPGGPTGIAADQMAWKTNGQGGLNLEILNAMDDRWTQPLSVAVQNWDDGYPIDSLTLRVTRVSIDPTCTEETGKLKICNADYGNTRWRGLNNLLLNRQTQEIVSSSAKMNEFYLEQESNDQKLYTLCHGTSLMMYGWMCGYLGYHDYHLSHTIATLLLAELGHGFGLPHWDEDFFNRDMGNCMDYT